MKYLLTDWLDELITKKHDHLALIGIFVAIAVFTIDKHIDIVPFFSLTFALYICFNIFLSSFHNDIKNGLNIFSILFGGIITPLYLYLIFYSLELHPDLIIFGEFFLIFLPINLTIQFILFKILSENGINWWKYENLCVFGSSLISLIVTYYVTQFYYCNHIPFFIKYFSH